MSKWDKLLYRILNLSNEIRFDELRKILEYYGYTMYSPRVGSNHYTFRKIGNTPITIPKHEPIKKIYVKKVKDLILKEGNTMNKLKKYLPFKLMVAGQISCPNYHDIFRKELSV